MPREMFLLWFASNTAVSVCIYSVSIEFSLFFLFAPSEILKTQWRYPCLPDPQY